ncbi:hypothetical protein SDC9_179895 [bioreactor metagenome]|uniref:Uncharacterized protein n=1 Tax=bioreactor metagenome TaxID=1076179 RepID=A0A645H045_9ZZZZ
MLSAVGGMEFETFRTSASGMPNARPTSRIAFLLFIRPNVMIWETWSLPYFWTMDFKSSSRPRSETSVSISGMLIRSGLRNRSKRRSYRIGSSSVILRLYATSDPAADPLPGPMGIPRSFASCMIPDTIRKYPANPIVRMTDSS